MLQSLHIPITNYQPTKKAVIATAKQLKSELIYDNGPISLDEILDTQNSIDLGTPVAEEVKPVVSEVVPEETEPTVNEVLPEETEPEVDLGEYVVKSGANSGKKLNTLTDKELNKTLKYAPNKEDKESVKAFLDSREG